MNKICSLLTLSFITVTLNTSTKIYDCFLFFNELELLNIRLHELYNHVDAFVLVESKETFRGASKPLYYQQNKHLFEKFAHKIIHIIVEEHPEFSSPWDRESFQRNQIMRGLTACASDDIILISDADEIIRPSKIPELLHMLKQETQESYKIVLCHQTLYRYFLNRFDTKDNPWPGTIGLVYKDLQHHSPEYYRQVRQNSSYVIYNAGWHFTYMGGYNRVVTKLAAFSHAECDTPTGRDPHILLNRIASFPLVLIDESFPAYILTHQQDYEEKGFIDTSDEITSYKNIILRKPSNKAESLGG